MKLGTETGSLVNHLYSRATVGQPEPTVGMGATLLHWTDRQAATIVKVYGAGKRSMIDVQVDSFRHIDKNGLSECQEYEYSRDPNGTIYTFAQDANGTWRGACFNEATRRWIKSEGAGLRIGDRRQYHDFTF